MANQQFLAVANLLFALTIVSMCLCRLNVMTPTVMYRVRSEYSAYLASALASGLSPLWGEWPGWGQLSVTCAVLFGMVLSSDAWRHGPPATTLSDTPRGAKK